MLAVAGIRGSSLRHFRSLRPSQTLPPVRAGQSDPAIGPEAEPTTARLPLMNDAALIYHGLNDGGPESPAVKNMNEYSQRGTACLVDTVP